MSSVEQSSKQTNKSFSKNDFDNPIARMIVKSNFNRAINDTATDNEDHFESNIKTSPSKNQLKKLEMKQLNKIEQDQINHKYRYSVEEDDEDKSVMARERKDQFGNVIARGSKSHRIVFADHKHINQPLTEIIEVESFKKFNQQLNQNNNCCIII